MNDPHVEKLIYRVVPSENIDYDRAPSISGETEDFKWQLNNKELAVEMITHCASEEEAREIIDEYLKGWEVMTGLFYRPDELHFKFSSSKIHDRASDNEKNRNKVIAANSTEIISLTDEIKPHVSYANFPPHPVKFKVSPEVEMMYMRYKMYREGKETLLGMAHWCLTVLEYSAGGINEAADQYQIELKVLRKLRQLCVSQGNVSRTWKLKRMAGVSPLKPAEREWIRAVVKRLILRAGDYAFDPACRLSMITMDDFTSIQWDTPSPKDEVRRVIPRKMGHRVEPEGTP